MEQKSPAVGHPWRQALLETAIGLVIAFGATSLVMIAVGINPISTTVTVIKGVFGNGFGVGNMLHEATQLIFPAVGVALAFQAGLFNIGGDGQIGMASLGVALTAWMLGDTSPWLLWPLAIIVAFACGAAWAAPAAWIKAKRGGHEVIATMMLYWIALAAIQAAFKPEYPWVVQGTVQTYPVPPADLLPTWSKLGVKWFGFSKFNISVLLAIAVLFLHGWFLWRTHAGLGLRSVGKNPGAAQAAGWSVPKTIFLSLLISGGLAGLLAVDEVLGRRGSFGPDSLRGQGFTAVGVALLGRCHPIGIAAAAILFGALTQGGVVLKLNKLPRELVDLVQAFVMIAVIVGPVVTAWMLDKIRNARAAKS